MSNTPDRALSFLRVDRAIVSWSHEVWMRPNLGFQPEEFRASPMPSIPRNATPAQPLTLRAARPPQAGAG